VQLVLYHFVINVVLIVSPLLGSESVQLSPNSSSLFDASAAVVHCNVFCNKASYTAGLYCPKAVRIGPFHF